MEEIKSFTTYAAESYIKLTYLIQVCPEKVMLFRLTAGLDGQRKGAKQDKLYSTDLNSFSFLDPLCSESEMKWEKLVGLV